MTRPRNTLLDILPDIEWQENAYCQDVTNPQIFFPIHEGDTNNARQYCNQCPVASECLEFAMKHGIHYGIWGGLNTAERRRLKRKRYKDATR